MLYGTREGDRMSKYAGAWPTMVIPYDSNMRIDVGAYRTMIEWYIDRGVGGLYVNCLSSEMYLMG